MPLFNAVLVGHIFLYILFPWIIFNAVLVSLISMCILFLCIFCGNALDLSEFFRPGVPVLKQHIVTLCIVSGLSDLYMLSFLYAVTCELKGSHKWK